MKFKFIGKERRFISGRYYNPGDIIEEETKPNKWFEEIEIKKSKKGDKDVMES